jgi:alkylation response protein AidB-like acyl-CoA dehydrogenase
MSNAASAKAPKNASQREAIRFGSPELRRLVDDIGRSTATSVREEVNPHAAIELVRQSGLGAVRVPRGEGGSGWSVREFFSMFIDLAEADPNIPHILRAHYWFVEERLRSTNPEERALWIGRIVRGDIFGNAVTELGGSAAIGAYIMNTQLNSAGDEFVLNGTKYYCTGSLYSDWVSVLASTPEGKLASAVIPIGRAGVTLKDDWDGIGQRLTGSGTGIFKNVIVHVDEVLHPTLAKNEDGQTVENPTEPYLVGQICQLILTAIIVGVLRSVVSDAVAMVRKRERTYTHACAETAAADPQLQEIIGRIASITFAAEAVVLAAADAQDEALATVVDGVANLELTHRASLLAAKAKVMIDDVAPRAATLLFDVGGSSAIKQSENLDRHWRNIRTLSSHNPTPYKARAIGDYLVNGKFVPQNGFF